MAMQTLFLRLLLAGAVVAPGQARAAAQNDQAATAVPAAGREQVLQKARALTELITPYDVMLASNMRAWEAAVAAAMKADPAVQKLEAAYPGIIKASIDAGRAVGRRYCEKYVRLSAEHKAGLIAARLTPTEIDEASRLYGRPSWRRFVVRLTGNVDMAKTVQGAVGSMRETGKPGLTEEGLRETVDDAARASGEQTSAEDQIDLMRLAQAKMFPKIKLIGEESDRQALVWANNPEPETVAEQQEAMRKAMIAFADRRKK